MTRDFESAGVETPRLDLEQLSKWAAKLRPGSTIVEVGSWAGRTALAMAKSSPSIRIYCIDTWAGSESDVTGELAKGNDIFATFCRNVGDLLFRRIFPCRGESAQWASVWPHKVDMVFIDADHEEEAVRQDVQAWSKHILPGGLLCGHDYGVFPGVTKVANELPLSGVGGSCLWWKRM